jgi:1-pyrroline-5-carboxylate dehydrogenase
MSQKIDYSSSTLGDADTERRFEAALSVARSTKAPAEPHVVDGQELFEGAAIERQDPCHPGVVVGRAHEADATVVDRAVAAAKAAAKGWRRTPYAERNAMLLKAREELAGQVPEISALVSAETGKTRLEAVGEVQEVLDMIAHYTRLMADNDGYAVQQISTETEKNYDVLVPVGVFGVISPFNFPAALLVGMTSAALVTGNTVVLKPSDKTPRSSGVIARILAEQLPAGVLNVVHGGAETGKALAATDVDGIAFTGSSAVGWQLVETPRPNGLPRPVLAEMGGQNVAVVAASADLDAAASGIVRSAFGLSGQKCSACRRVVVERSVADELAAKIVERAEAMVLADPIDPAAGLGPVIDDAIAARVDEAIAKAQADGRVLTGGRADDLEGNWFRPVVVTDLPIGHRLTREELFAPFLTIIAVDSFEDAMTEANAVEYGLSAGVFSADPEQVDTFLDEIEAGVLYVNRAAGATTGAWPGVQSFCGWKRSGSTGKGGLGVHYLQGFMREQSRTIVVDA